MKAMPTATGLFEAHLTVSDLDRSVEFYRDVIGLPLALVVEDRGAAFFWVGAPGEAMLGLWSLGSAPMGLSLHIALRASLEDVLAASEGLRSNDVTPLSFFGAETSEPSVIGWMPAAAVYFRDPDGHMIEYLAMLEEPARVERGIVPWSQWASRDLRTVKVRIERHSGARSELRALFEEAEDSAAELNGYIDAGDVLVARAGTGVVGHLQLIDAGNGASEIKNMAVEAPYRGRGTGRRLVDAAVDLARAKGHSMLAVATAAADVGNLRFYQRAGFRMRAVERDAFTPAAGYPELTTVDGIRLRDRVWLDLDLSTHP
jgi:GNAT superfamily N-acetyltransferase/catechol 2,3-dioxygenase-like lactoylglutathione lyase family enzyme